MLTAPRQEDCVTFQTATILRKANIKAELLESKFMAVFILETH